MTKEENLFEKCDHWGKKFWEDKKIKEKNSRAGYFATIVVMIIFIYLLTLLPDFNISWLDHSSLTPARWILGFSFFATIVVNFLYIFFNPYWFKTLCQMVLNIISYIVVSTVYSTFPFLVSGEVEKEIKMGLFVLGIILLISILVEFIKIVFYILKKM